MIRTLTPYKPELIRLCHTKSWNAIYERALSHPLEAELSESCLSGEGSTALAASVRSGAPLCVVEALLRANAHQLGITNRQRGNCLTEALKARVSDDVLEFLLQSMIDYQRLLCNSRQQVQVESTHLKHVGIQESAYSAV
jgi:hypothetical protein